MSARDFNIGIYREHLDEASFLYAQRRAYLNDPEIKWTALSEWEDRIEAHIDALALGGSLATEICRQAVSEPADLYPLLSVLCRRRLKHDAFAMLAGLDPAEELSQQACFDALCREAPTDWQRDLIAGLADRKLTSVCARVVGYRRFAAAEEELARLVSSSTHPGKADLAWALGRLGGAGSISVLLPLLGDPDDAVRECAATALLRIGDKTPLRLAMDAVPEHRWARRVLGLSGSLQAVSLLLEDLHRSDFDPDTVLALGLLGHLAAVSRLLDSLKGDAADTAAVALNTITGAALHTSLFVPDLVDIDENGADENSVSDRKGDQQAPKKQYGTWERRVLSNREGWQAWLDQNRHRFNRELRWRVGLPYGPRALVQCLRLETTPHAIRKACYEELVIRYRLDVPFEIDLPVRQQLRFLDRIETWVSTQAANFTEGQWYLDGRPQA